MGCIHENVVPETKQHRHVEGRVFATEQLAGGPLPEAVENLR